MGPAPRWPTTALRYLSPVILLLLVAQYLLGIWTNLYAPPAGFTSNSSSPSLDWHYNLGFTLGLLSIVALILAGISRSVWLIGPAVLLFLGVLIAGLAGGAFVGMTPNPANDSFLMGAMFLVALLAGLGLAFRSRMAFTKPSSAPVTPAPAG